MLSKHSFWTRLLSGVQSPRGYFRIAANEGKGEIMLRRATVIALFAVVLGVFAQTASADPSHAKNAGFFTAVCGSTQLQVVVNGNGTFSPAHVVGSTSVFVPTAFNLTSTFTPSGGAPEVETETSSKAHTPTNAVTCELPAALNTFTFPEGTFVLSGTVTGFFTPSSYH
jgi:hypothetical protein